MLDLTPLEPKLRGKVAVVTGGARGLGRAYCHRLARLGAKVLVADIDLRAWAEFDEPLAAESVAAECRSWGAAAAEFAGDLSDPATAQAMVATAVAELGGCDILVNNAGGMLRGPASGIPSTMTPADLQFTLEINFHSAVYCCQAALPLMRQAGWGRIINVSSQAGVKGVERGAHYAVAKSAVVEYTRCLALEVGPDGINVNCLVPALIWSSRARAQFPDRGDAAPGLPLRRIGEPEDCAKVVEFFATDLSDYVTGQCLAVCGGALLFAH